MMKPDMMYQQQVKKWLVVTSIGVGVVMGLYWLANHAFLKVQVPLINDGEATIQIYDQNSRKITYKNVRAGQTISLLTTRGGKEVSVLQNGTSYFEVLSVPGFLQSRSVKASLAPEKQRTFIGNNPEPCMQYGGGILYSFACGGNISDLVAHLPADAQEPSTAMTYEDIGYGEIAGSISDNSNTVILNKVANEGDEADSYSYIAYVFDNLGNKIAGRVLDKIPSGIEYRSTSYMNGLLMYGPGLDRFISVSSDLGDISEVNIEPPNNTDYIPQSLTTNASNIVVLFTAEDFEELEDNPEPPKIKSEILIADKGQTRHIYLDYYYNEARICGVEKLCALYGKTVSVFDIKGNGAKELYKIHNIDSLLEASNGLLVSRGKELILFDVTKKTGSFLYSYDKYRSCGVQKVRSGYALCIISPDNDKFALFIDPDNDISDAIDKKIGELAQHPDIAIVSIYGRYIYISPELGDRIYRADIGGYGYDPKRIQELNQRIDTEIDRIGIDRNMYSIINTRAD